MPDPNKTGARSEPARRSRTSRTATPGGASDADAAAAAQAHPKSGHRTPEEIQRDEAGAVGAASRSVTGDPAGGPKPEKHLGHPSPSKEEEHIRDAVRRSSHPRR
jgi:hypothetical protein